MKGRRVATVEDITQPGDYCGPVMGYTGDRPAVFYKLPVDDPQIPMSVGITMAHICSPPHTFRECADGSLEIRNSILHTYRYWEPFGAPHETQHQVTWQWHGYLDEGHEWRTV